MDIDVPAFDFRVLDADNPSHAFVKRFVAGRAPFIRWTVPVRVDADSARWMLDCCAAVVALPRADVCTLHAYTTQVVYGAVQGLLRHPGDPDTYVTGLVQVDQAAHALWGFEPLRIALKAGAQRRYLDGGPRTVDLLRRFEAECGARKWRAAEKTYAALLPHTNAAFRRLCRARATDSHDGLMLFAQAAAVLNQRPTGGEALLLPKRGGPTAPTAPTDGAIRTLTDYKRVIGRVTELGWVRVLQRFAADLDAAFAKMPPTRKPLVLFRGVKCGEPRTDPAFLSTALERDSVRSFACGAGGRIVRVTVPAGRRVLPLTPVSRYSESEVLLPRLPSRTRYRYA